MFEWDKANIQISRNRLGPKVHLLFLLKAEILLGNYWTSCPLWSIWFLIHEVNLVTFQKMLFCLDCISCLMNKSHFQGLWVQKLELWTIKVLKFCNNESNKEDSLLFLYCTEEQLMLFSYLSLWNYNLAMDVWLLLTFMSLGNVNASCGTFLQSLKTQTFTTSSSPQETNSKKSNKPEMVYFSTELSLQ